MHACIHTYMHLHMHEQTSLPPKNGSESINTYACIHVHMHRQQTSHLYEEVVVIVCMCLRYVDDRVQGDDAGICMYVGMYVCMFLCMYMCVHVLALR